MDHTLSMQKIQIRSKTINFRCFEPLSRRCNQQFILSHFTSSHQSTNLLNLPLLETLQKQFRYYYQLLTRPPQQTWITRTLTSFVDTYDQITTLAPHQNPQTQVIMIYFEIGICHQQQLTKPRINIFQAFEMFYLEQTLKPIFVHKRHFGQIRFIARVRPQSTSSRTSAACNMQPNKHIDFPTQQHALSL